MKSVKNNSEVVSQKPGFLRGWGRSRSGHGWCVWAAWVSLYTLLEPEVIRAGGAKPGGRLLSVAGDQLPRTFGKGSDFIERAVLWISLTAQLNHGLFCLTWGSLLISPLRTRTNQCLPPGQPGRLPSRFNFLHTYHFLVPLATLQTRKMNRWAGSSCFPPVFLMLTSYLWDMMPLFFIVLPERTMLGICRLRASEKGDRGPPDNTFKNSEVEDYMVE